jgi:hypothetical protein
MSVKDTQVQCLVEQTEVLKVSFKRRRTVLPPYPPEATTEASNETAMTAASVQARPPTHSHTNNKIRIRC